MASKLSGFITGVETAIGAVNTTMEKVLLARMAISVGVNKQIPDLIKAGKMDEAATIQGYMAGHQRNYNTHSAAAVRRLGELDTALTRLETHIRGYDPARKKSGANMRPGQVEARTAKKKAAQAIVAKANKLLAQSDNVLNIKPV